MNNKGFTLIELLVVIAIIGILSGIVLTSLSGARNKAKEAEVQADLSGLRTAAELYYNNTGNSYGTASACGASGSMFAEPTTVKPYIDGINKSINGTGGTAYTGMVCISTATAYAVGATVNGVVYCVDSTGKAGKVNALPVGSACGAIIN